MQKFCTTCGKPLKPGSKYCTFCGSPVLGAPRQDGPAASAPQPVVPTGGNARHFENHNHKERKARRALVLDIAAALAVVLVGVAAVAVWLNGGVDQVLGRIAPGASIETAYYASTEELTVAASTRIVPKRAADEPLSKYTARVKQADDPDGSALAIDDIPGLSVEGDEGFTLRDFGELEPGTYWLGIEADSGDRDGEDNSSLYDLPPLTLDDSDTQSDPPSKLEVLPPAGADDETKLVRRGKCGSYYDVLDGLIQTYGDASLSVLKLDDSKYETWVAGVSYAGLVNFGDGVERLVVMYCTEKEFAASDAIELSDDLPPTDGLGPAVDNYRVEVYEYDEVGDEATMVCQMAPANEDGSNEPELMLVESPDGLTCLVAGPKGAGSYGQVCYGVDTEGAFDALTVGTKEFSRWTVVQRFRFVSLGSSQEAALGDAGAQELSCEETAQTVKDLTARLKTLAG